MRQLNRGNAPVFFLQLYASQRYNSSIRLFFKLRRAPASPFPPRSHVESRGIFSFPQNDKKTPLTLANQGLIGIRQRLILPGRVQPSTFSTGELNCCVRDGNRWNLSVIATGNGSYFVASTFSFLLSFYLLAFEREGSKLKVGETPLHPDNCTSNDSLDRSN